MSSIPWDETTMPGVMVIPLAVLPVETAPASPSGDDVVALVRRRHEQIAALLETVLASRDGARSRAFFSLRRLIAVHEAAEEEVLHPAVRRYLPDGDAVADARLREEHGLKVMLVELERIEGHLDLGPDSPVFEVEFALFRDATLAHNEAEEAFELAALPRFVDGPARARMGRMMAFAEAIAPTRPHPGMESRLANLLAAPFASVVDRVRDTITNKGS